MDYVITEYGHVSRNTAGHIVRKLIEATYPITVTERHLDEAIVIPKNEGRVAKLRQYLPFTNPSAPLSEGVSPKGQRPTYRDVTIVLEEWGEVVVLTNVVQDVAEDPIVNKVVVPGLSQLTSQTKEINRINVWKAGSTVLYAGGPTIVLRTSVVSAISRGDIAYAIKVLEANSAQRVSKIIKASPAYATEPIAACYFAFAHTDMREDFKRLPGFIQTYKYANPGEALPGEVGFIDPVRV